MTDIPPPDDPGSFDAEAENVVDETEFATAASTEPSPTVMDVPTAPAATAHWISPKRRLATILIAVGIGVAAFAGGLGTGWAVAGKGHPRAATADQQHHRGSMGENYSQRVGRGHADRPTLNHPNRENGSGNSQPGNSAPHRGRGPGAPRHRGSAPGQGSTPIPPTASGGGPTEPAPGRSRSPMPSADSPSPTTPATTG